MTVHSPAPGVPQTPTKAVASGVVSFFVLFGMYYVADVDPFTKKEIVEALILAVIGSGLTGGTALMVKNRPK
jgi:hypothetical protein